VHCNLIAVRFGLLLPAYQPGNWLEERDFCTGQVDWQGRSSPKWPIMCQVAVIIDNILALRATNPSSFAIKLELREIGRYNCVFLFTAKRQSWVIYWINNRSCSKLPCRNRVLHICTVYTRLLKKVTCCTVIDISMARQ